MAKILKNNTASDIDIAALGRRVPASGQLDLDTSDFIRVASTDVISELTSLINSGDITVNDGVADLSSSEGIDYINYPDNAKSSRFDNSSNDFTADSEQEAIEEARNTIIRKTFSVTFHDGGTVSGGVDYLSWADDLGTSDEIPFVIPFNCELIAVTYTNEDPGTDNTIQIRRSNFNSGSTQNIVLSISQTNVRTACYTNFTRPSFNAGDKLAVSLQDNGGNADEPRVYLMFQTTDDTLQNLTENWSGNL